MKIVLSIGFDEKITDYFEIENPAIIPLEGETFDCKWDDFITDLKLLEILQEEDDMGTCWIVHIVYKYFSKNQITIHISLKNN